MALKKEIEYASGAKAEYHRIVYTEIDWENQKARVGFVSYINQVMRDAGKPPLLAAPNYFMLPLSGSGPLPFNTGDSLATMFATVYGEMKRLTEFAGAEDV